MDSPLRPWLRTSTGGNTLFEARSLRTMSSRWSALGATWRGTVPMTVLSPKRRIRSFAGGGSAACARPAGNSRKQQTRQSTGPERNEDTEILLASGETAGGDVAVVTLVGHDQD